MIYKNLKIFFALLCLAVAASCSEDSYLQQSTTQDGTLPIENTTVHQLGDTFKIAFTSAVNWQLTLMENGYPSTPDWIKVYPSSGKVGTTVITFTVEPNITSDDRKCDVNFSKRASAEVMESFSISQNKVILELSESAFNFGWKNTCESGQQTFDVTSNVEWDLTLDNEKFFSAEYSGDDDGVAQGNETVTIRAKENNFSIENKTAVIKVVPVKRNNKGERVDLNINFERKIDISQDYLIFLVNDGRETTDLQSFSELGADYVAQGTVDASAHMTEQQITVTSEIGTDWAYDISDISDDWGLELMLSPDEENIEIAGRKAIRKTLAVSVKKPNPSKGSRDADFNLYVLADNVKEKRTVKIHQDAYLFNTVLKSSDTSFDNLSGENILSLETTGPWEILSEDVPSWLAVSPMSGLGSADITIKAENQNLEFEDLRDNISFLSGLNDLKSEYAFSQDKFIFDVEWPDNFGTALSRIDTNEYQVYVTSSGPWTLKLRSSAQDDAQDWVDIDRYSGAAGRQKVTIKANSANPDKNNERGKVITISSDLHDVGNGNAVHVNEFIQDRFRFDLIRNDVDITSNPVNFTAYKKYSNTSGFTMRCSAPWRMSTDCSWLTFSQSEGKGDTYPEIIMTAHNNVSGEWNKSREAIVTVKSDPEGNGAYSDSKTFKVIQDGLVFEVSPSSASYSVGTLNEETYQFTVTATDGLPWSVVQGASWVGLQSGSSSGTATISFKPSHNGSLSSRESTLKVESGEIENMAPVILNVIQSEYRFDNNTVDLRGFKELNPEGQNLEIDCMGPWTIENCPLWVTVDKTSGRGNAIVTVTPVKNTVVGTNREGTFNVVSRVGGEIHKKVVTVTQDPFIWNVIFSAGNVAADAVNGGTGALSFICSGSWKASSNKDFVTLSKQAGDGGKYVTEYVSITVAPNYTMKPRNAIVTVTSDDDSAHTETISVSQSAYEFNVGDVMDNFTHGGGVKTTTAICSEPLNVSSSAGWLRASVSGDILTLEAEENKQTSDRTATVTVSSPHLSNNPELTKTITVTQDASPVQ